MQIEISNLPDEILFEILDFNRLVRREMCLVCRRWNMVISGGSSSRKIIINPYKIYKEVLPQFIAFRDDFYSDDSKKFLKFLDDNSDKLSLFIKLDKNPFGDFAWRYCDLSYAILREGYFSLFKRIIQFHCLFDKLTIKPGKDNNYGNWNKWNAPNEFEKPSNDLLKIYCLGISNNQTYDYNFVDTPGSVPDEIKFSFSIEKLIKILNISYKQLLSYHIKNNIDKFNKLKDAMLFLNSAVRVVLFLSPNILQAILFIGDMELIDAAASNMYNMMNDFQSGKYSIRDARFYDYDHIFENLRSELYLGAESLKSKFIQMSCPDINKLFYNCVFESEESKTLISKEYFINKIKSSADMYVSRPTFSKIGISS